MKMRSFWHPGSQEWTIFTHFRAVFVIFQKIGRFGKNGEKIGKMGGKKNSFPSNLLPTYIPNYPESFSQIRGDSKFAKIRAFSRGHHPLLKQ